MYKHFLKRVVDFIFSLIGLILLSPIFLVLALLIKIDSRGPVLFKQKRVGKNKKYFNILKFRTMRIDTPKDTPTHLMENPQMWITKVGGILRKYSLDEIPQLINILRGDMSFVGPRPALWTQEDLIYERDRYRVNVLRPGLTGWAQVNGRDEIPNEQKVKLDALYARRYDLFFDAHIFFKTVFWVVHAKGVREGGQSSQTQNANSAQTAIDSDVQDTLE